MLIAENRELLALYRDVKKKKEKKKSETKLTFLNGYHSIFPPIILEASPSHLYFLCCLDLVLFCFPVVVPSPGPLD